MIATPQHAPRPSRRLDALHPQHQAADRLPAGTGLADSLSAEERELMQAMEAYKQRSGRMFPTWSEVLEVLVELGYRKPDPS